MNLKTAADVMSSKNNHYRVFSFFSNIYTPSYIFLYLKLNDGNEEYASDSINFNFFENMYYTCSNTTFR